MVCRKTKADFYKELNVALHDGTVVQDELQHTQEELNRLRLSISETVEENEIWRNMHYITFLDSGGKLVSLPVRDEATARRIVFNLKQDYDSNHVRCMNPKLFEKGPSTWTISTSWRFKSEGEGITC